MSAFENWLKTEFHTANHKEIGGAISHLRLAYAAGRAEPMRVLAERIAAQDDAEEIAAATGVTSDEWSAAMLRLDLADAAARVLIAAEQEQK